MARFVKQLTTIVFLACVAWTSHAAEPFCPKGNSPSPNVIWCDSFEDEDLAPNGTVSGNYFEFDTDSGDHARVSSESFDGKYSLRSRWQAGEVDAGHFMRNFGRNPIGSQSHSQQDFREIYWRFYFKLQDAFTGFPDKYTRAISFAGPNWQQAMAAHLWADENARDHLLLDPTTWINDQSQLTSTKWNDFANQIWLGAKRGATTIQAGRWYCLEAHVKLNTPGQSDGVFEFWIDDKLDAAETNLNWVKSWTDYGINSVFFSDYWNAGSPKEQERYLDAVVISSQRVGCMNTVRPLSPTNLRVQ
jgi:Polysaccharide lyase 14